MPYPIESQRNKLSAATLSSWCQALVLGAAVFLVPAFAATQGEAGDPPAAKSAGKQAGKGKAAIAKADASTGSRKPASKTGKTGKNAAQQKPGPLADFGEVKAPPDVVHVANWASYTRDHKKKAFVVIDKKAAELYVFDGKARLKSRTPVLLGKAVGDDAAPGIGNKPLSRIKEEEKTTPAGRFLAAPGRNTKGEDIIWIDYDTAVSMHRLRKVSAEQKRAERMSTPEASDNRISYGCVNVPASFYDRVLKPTVVKQGAFVYVLPETRTPQQQFGSFDVGPDKAKDVRVAEAPAGPGRAGK